MAARSVLLALAAVALLGSGAALLLVPGAPRPPSVEVAPPAPALSRIKVATRDLAPGTFLQEADTRWQDWPQNAVLPEHIVAGAAKDASGGAMVRHRIAAGEPLMRSRLIAPGDRGFLAAVLAPGMRAISVAVTEVSGTAGLIYPGDRVDLILTQVLTVEKNDAHRLVGETVLEDVRVIAVDQRVEEAARQNEPGKGKSVANTVTLEVNSRDAEKIAVAAELGRLTLALHSIARKDEAPAAERRPEPTWASTVSAALTLLPAAEPSRKEEGKESGNGAERPGLAIIRGTELVRQSF